MTDIERKATFYLGKEYDLQSGEVLDDQHIMYDARDLTTHAVCIGMTGSGKTGLGVTLLEEAALDGIPSIIIDPKGDMTNLLLTFPELRQQDFEPWVNVDDARRKGKTPGEYAASMADLWRNGIAGWGQDGERIRRLKESAEFTIYTPGSNAGVPVSVLQTFSAPSLDWDDDEETLRELVGGTVSGLLALVGIEADPVQSREHILLSNIFEDAWRNGEDLSLATLIQRIQSPPMEKMGVFDIDTFYPEKDRFTLAMAMNRLVAAPSFENWIEGVPLDIAQIIETPEGKPRCAIFYIAHLEDAERMFFVTLLLQQIISWMRQLSGTTSLRCLVYFDEIFGYFPPYPKNPPSKNPLLTLLKMARAYGVGMMLTTQNPVDLDYKGLTNTGTWFVGKLQTDRDKARVLEGMEGVVSEAGTMLDRKYLDRLISSLDSRVFILHNVHEDAPVLYNTRWALSYLRGPMTRRQVRELMADQKARLLSNAISHKVAPADTVASGTQRVTHAAASARPPEPEVQPPAGYTPVQPRVHARVPQYFLDATISKERAIRLFAEDYRRRLVVKTTHLAYEPQLFGLVSVMFGDPSRTQTIESERAFKLPLPDAHGLVDWDEGIAEGLTGRDLVREGMSGALFNTLPDGMTESPPYTAMRNDLVDWIYRHESLSVFQHEALKLTGDLNETRANFERRCQQAARDAMRAELDREGKRWQTQIDRLIERLSREERELEDDEIDLQGRRGEELISGAGAAFDLVSGLLAGRKRRVSTGLSSAARRRRMTAKAKADVRESEEAITRMERDLERLGKDRDDALADIEARWEGVDAQITEKPVRPRKTDIRVQAFGLAWEPAWIVTYEDERGLLRDASIPAFETPLTEQRA